MASMAGSFAASTKVNAVDHVSFSVEAGEIVAFLGPNGAGKTTTLKLLSGVIIPRRAGPRAGLRPLEARKRLPPPLLALVMGQKNQLWWDLPAQESFRLHREIYRIDAAVFQRRLDELASLLGVRQAASASRCASCRWASGCGWS